MFGAKMVKRKGNDASVETDSERTDPDRRKENKHKN